MQSRRAVLATVLAALLVSTVNSLAGPAGADAAVTVAHLHFKVTTGPGDDHVYDVVGDLYLPATASAANRVPAILATNGFGGSKDDFTAMAPVFVRHGYAFLAYSGLGFGGSDGKITLDDPDWDGKAASQLIDYLAGKPGIAFLDDAHTQAAPGLGAIQLDAAGDPRLGTIGKSYGGQSQFALAGRDHRVDAMVPIITWNDLSYSLAPNNTALTGGVSSSVPGAVKLNWAAGFTEQGVQRGVENVLTDPERIAPCPNFADWVCPTLVVGATTGYLLPDGIARLRHASVSSYLAAIKAPTLLIQGEADTLFNLNEAAASYAGLRAQHTPVKMIWQSWGHSQSTPAPGEFDWNNPDPATQYTSARVFAWFDRYLKHQDVDTGPPFSYFRNWVPYTGIATPAFGTAPGYPAGSPATWYLSGSALTKGTPVIGSQTFLTPAGGLATSTGPVDALGSVVSLPALPELDAPGTYAYFTSAPLVGAVDVAGAPVVHLKVASPTAALTQALGPAGMLTLFLRIVDVAPDGPAATIENLVAPVRIANVTQPFAVTLPAVVHRFGVGHRIRLVVAGGSLNYRGGLLANTVTITTGATSQSLVLPTVG